MSLQAITVDEIERNDVDLVLPPDPEFADEYKRRVTQGRYAAKHRSVAFVAICRNAMPFLPRTLRRVEIAGEMFESWSCFIYENDSVDSTKDCLRHWCSLGGNRKCSLRDNGRPHLNASKSSDRTIALAEYRNQCRLWVAEECPLADYVVVFDTDPWGGFSVDGIANTIGHLEDFDLYSNASGFASYSYCVFGPPICDTPTPGQYDAWACRWTWWRERQNMAWFHMWHPPVGSPPVKMNSAFGQLAVYRAADYVNGEYSGGDCEHVPFHRSLGGDLYLNPSSRVVSFWVPGYDIAKSSRVGMHGDVLPDVDGRNPDTGDRRDSQDLG